jgi:hypothetical protein
VSAWPAAKRVAEICAITSRKCRGELWASLDAVINILDSKAARGQISEPFIGNNSYVSDGARLLQLVQ